jgi:hypothetical protein
MGLVVAVLENEMRDRRPPAVTMENFISVVVPWVGSWLEKRRRWAVSKGGARGGANDDARDRGVTKFALLSSS